MPARPLWPTAALSLLPLLWLAAPPSALAQEAPTVKLATNVERSYFPPAEALLRKAYASLGLQVEFVPWPLNRAQLELAAGRLDGVAMRTDTFFAQLPSVRKVDVPLLTLHVYAFARPPCPASVSLEELARRRIAHQRGMVAVEALVPEAVRLPANTPSDAFLMVGMGAADYALMLSTPWMSELPVLTRQGSLCRVATPLSQTVLYHGVHESQAGRVAALEQVLRAMRERGEIQQAWTAYEREIASQNSGLQAQPGRSLTLTPAAAPGSAPAQPPR